MKKWKKYLRGMVAALLTILAVVLCVILGIKLAKFFLPFVIGWIIALIASPLVRIVERRLRIARKHTSMVIIVLVLAALIGGIYLVGAKVARETGNFIQQAPELYGGFKEEFQEVEHNLERFIKQLPEDVQISIDDAQEKLGMQIGKMVTSFSEITVDFASNTAKNLPSAFIGFIFTLLSAYFFIADRDRILEFGRANTPAVIQEKWKLFSDSFKKVFGGYFKAQLKIMAVIWIILCAGLLFLHVRFAVFVAFLVALLDMLPFFGTGTALIPWAIFKILSGDMRYALGLLILYLLTQLVRRVIEPKMVGDSIGMNPLLTLIFMYTGYKISSILGMILAVPIGAIVINFYEAGMFDGPLKAAREILDDFLVWIHNSEETE